MYLIIFCCDSDVRKHFPFQHLCLRITNIPRSITSIAINAFQRTHPPSVQPTGQPSSQPHFKPSNQPSKQPLSNPSKRPSFRPSRQPSLQPDRFPTKMPTYQPTKQPFIHPSKQPISNPSKKPLFRPTSQPSRSPTFQPQFFPTKMPSYQPTFQPSRPPTRQPFSHPTRKPLAHPTKQPISNPTKKPSFRPTSQPSRQPSLQPHRFPTKIPTHQPTVRPSSQLFRPPTRQPFSHPTRQPYSHPTKQPLKRPSLQPSLQPTGGPSFQPFKKPSSRPSVQPRRSPSLQPSHQPTRKPFIPPSCCPTLQPSLQPITPPTKTPTFQPSLSPTILPSRQPSSQPSFFPSRQRYLDPTRQPYCCPTGKPLRLPSSGPSQQPSLQPFENPTGIPSLCPSLAPIEQPIPHPTEQPLWRPTSIPSSQPRNKPFEMPSSQPTNRPNLNPSQQPTYHPKKLPTSQPLLQPSCHPSAQLSCRPTNRPSRCPTLQPSSRPSIKSTPTKLYASPKPSQKKSVHPTAKPSDGQAVAISSRDNLLNFNFNTHLVLTGMIFSYSACIAVWSVQNDSSLDLKSVSLNSVAQIVPAYQWTTLNLIIKPAVLSSNTYKFILQCNYLKSVVAVFPNIPPLDGYFRISPLSGFEISTQFNFFADRWVDEDLPLTYQFGYIGNGNIVQVIGSQSSRNTSTSPLPSVSSSFQSFINCSVEVFDSLGASTTTLKSVLVHSSPSDVISNYLNSTFHVSLITLPLKKISLIGSLLSKVNCSNAPSCDSLHRRECSSVDHTCGNCLPQYIGESGSHNSICFNAANIPNISQSKECANNCSRNGRCNFIDINSKQKVSDCPIISVSCEAICECRIGYSGSTCMLAVTELQQRKLLRNILMSNLLNISQNVQSPSAVVGAVSLLSLLTVTPDELSQISTFSAMKSVQNLLIAAITSQITYSDISDMILQAMDNVATTWNGSPRMSNGLTEVLIQHNSLVCHQMYPGQRSVSSVYTNFKVSSNTLLSETNISVPLTMVEIIAGIMPTEIDVSGLLSGDYGEVQATRIGLIEINPANQSSYRSNPIIVTVVGLNGAFPSRNITISLANKIPNDVSANGFNFSTVCHKRQVPPLIHRYVCPHSGYVVLHNCTNRVGVLTTFCPKYQPSCSNLTDLQHRLCEVVSFTELRTVCNCTVSMTEPITVRRQLDSSGQGNVAESTTLQLVATGEYLADEVAETFSAAPSLSSPEDLRKVVIVISFFGSLWTIGLILLLFGFSKRKSQFKSKLKRNQEEGKSISSRDLRNSLEAYISEIIPVIFRGSARSFEKLTAIFRHHKYAILFYSDCDFLISSARIVTVLSALMFILAISYDLQSPSDDGTCVQWQTEEDCLVRKSYLDSSQTYCQWTMTSSSSSSSEYSCSYQDPSTTVQEFLSVLVIVSIITALSLRPIDYLFCILSAPLPSPAVVPSEIDQLRGDGVKLKRRAISGVAGISVKEISESAITARKIARKSLHIQVSSNSLLKLNQRSKVTKATVINSNIILDCHTLSDVTFTRKQLLEELIKLIDNQRQSLSSKTLDDFESQWGLRKPSGLDLELSDVYFKSGIFDKIFEDVEHVRRTALVKISALKVVSEEQAGLEILHLFLKDLLGRDSPAAKIFNNKLEEDFEATRVVTFSRKVIAGIILVLLNVLFSYYTMLYGAVKGEAWQWIYLYACITQIVIEIFINETLECVWLNYLVPLLASREVHVAHRVLMDLVEKFCDQGSPMKFPDSECYLNAPDFLFVSTNVSKSFPSLMESTIIQSYHSCFPGENAKRWQRTRLQRLFESFRSLSDRRNGAVRYFLLAMTIILTFAEYCATVPYLLQRMLVRLIEPFFVAGIILVFYMVVSSPIYIATFFSFLMFIVVIIGRSLQRTKVSSTVSIVTESMDANKSDDGNSSFSVSAISSDSTLLPLPVLQDSRGSEDSSSCEIDISLDSCLSSDSEEEKSEGSSELGSIAISLESCLSSELTQDDQNSENISVSSPDDFISDNSDRSHGSDESCFNSVSSSSGDSQ